jgi:hypothetical protein
MLRKYIKTPNQEIVNSVEPVQTIVEVAGAKAAANAGNFKQSEMLARRMRRQRRMSRAMQRSNFGWKARAW